MVKQVQQGPDAVPTLVGKDPADAARDSYALADAAGDIANMGFNLMQLGRRREKDKADTNTAMMYTEATAGVNKPYSSANELRALGIDEDFMYEMVPGPNGPEKVDREEIAIDEYMPTVTQKVMDDILTAEAENFTFSSDREAWLVDRKLSLAGMVAKQQAASAQAAFEREVETDKMVIEDLISAGFYDMALERAAGFADPAQRQDMVRGTQAAVANAQYNEVLQSDDPIAMQEAAKDVTQDSRLGEAQQTAMKVQLESRAAQVVGAKTQKRVREYDMEMAAIGVDIVNNHPDAGQRVMAFYNKLEAEGRLDYIGPQWLKEQMTAIARNAKEGLDNQAMDAMIRAMVANPAAQGLYMGTQEKAAADRVAEAELAAAQTEFVQTGDPQSLLDGYEYVTNVALKTSYVPKVLKAAFAAVDKPGSNWQQAEVALASYNRIVDTNEGLLKDIPEHQRQMMSMMRSSFMSGQVSQDAFEAWKASLKQSTKEVRDLNRQAARDFISSGKAGEKFHEMTADQHSTLGESWLPFTEQTPKMTATLEAAFNAAYEQNYILTGDPDASADFAYSQVWSTYGRTDVNGKAEVWRTSPEVYYNMKSDEIRSDLNHWLDTNAPGWGGEEGYTIDDVIIRENVDTPFSPDGKPAYSLMVVRKDGLGWEPMTVDVNGAELHVTWRPDAEAFREREEAAALKRAEEERAATIEAERAAAQRATPEELTTEQLDELRSKQVKLRDIRFISNFQSEDHPDAIARKKERQRLREANTPEAREARLREMGVTSQ